MGYIWRLIVRFPSVLIAMNNEQWTMNYEQKPRYLYFTRMRTAIDSLVRVLIGILEGVSQDNPSITNNWLGYLNPNEVLKQLHAP